MHYFNCSYMHLCFLLFSSYVRTTATTLVSFNAIHGGYFVCMWLFILCVDNKNANLNYMHPCTTENICINFFGIMHAYPYAVE